MEINCKEIQAFDIIINQKPYVRINGVWYHGDRTMWLAVPNKKVDKLEKAFQDYKFSQYPESVQKALLEREELFKNGGPLQKDLDRVTELGNIIHEAIDPGIDRLFTEEKRIIHNVAKILRKTEQQKNEQTP